ncbi:aminodeoxychorismate lyase [Mycobacterium yunnanensis]|uniref:Aminodeoxychorismate lyase n=1 Tax=Mycobacterium yunnanensis TaxID=368477 RepID=A0A9X2YH17_9MYCO|nr:aminodeoxychorismate lyase [Mycobacterium yunnanensis]MCV7419082.1 aminodeoxychorismate lyase [Mycobacterium yunnanensis]
MTSPAEIVVTLDGAVVAAGFPVGHVDDPLFARGDGVFETLLVRGGRACLVGRHLDRLARSAASVGLPPPDQPRWRSAVATAARQWPGAGEAVMRLVWGRGHDGEPVGFVAASPLPDRVAAARRDGVSAITMDRGISVGEPPPMGAGLPRWSTADVKSLSYAVNAAALRHAQNHGADDVVLTSADGYVLEGPRSSVLIATGDGVLVTPPSTLPILSGTTVAAVFDVARRRGASCDERLLRPCDLLVAEGVWLLSSVTLAARVHTLDGHALAAADGVPDVAAMVDEAVGTPD